MPRSLIPDPLAVIEAGYDLAASDSEWVRRIAQAVSRELRGPAGCVGYRFDYRPGLGYMTHAFSVVDGDPDLATLTRSILRRFPTNDIARFFQCGGITSSKEACVFPMPVERGLVDFCGIVIGDAESGVTTGVPLPEAATIDRHSRRRWRRVCAHLTAIFRLRNALTAQSPARVEAVLTPAARIVHAAGAAQHRNARSVLQEAVATMERARGVLRQKDPSHALALWRELVAGRWTLVDEFESDGRRLIVAHVNPVDSVALRELTPRQQGIVRLVLEGRSAASIAVTLGISPGAVSQQIKLSLRKLRLGSVSALVKLKYRLANSSKATFSELDGVTTCAIEVGPVLDATAASRLSPAERHITCLLLDGLSNSEIAELRHCSYRTVANQIASLYEKLGIGSRTELAFCMSNGMVA